MKLTFTDGRPEGGYRDAAVRKEQLGSYRYWHGLNSRSWFLHGLVAPFAALSDLFVLPLGNTVENGEQQFSNSLGTRHRLGIFVSIVDGSLVSFLNIPIQVFKVALLQAYKHGGPQTCGGTPSLFRYR